MPNLPRRFVVRFLVVSSTVFMVIIPRMTYIRLLPATKLHFQNYRLFPISHNNKHFLDHIKTEKLLLKVLQKYSNCRIFTSCCTWQKEIHKETLVNKQGIFHSHALVITQNDKENVQNVQFSLHQ